MNARIRQAEQQAVEEKLLNVTLTKTMGGAIADPLSYGVGSSPTDLPQIADSIAAESSQAYTTKDTNCAEKLPPTPAAPGNADSTAAESPQENTADETNEQKATAPESTTDFQLTNSDWFFKEEISVDMQEVERRECGVSGLVPKKAEIKASEDGLTITVKGESKPISNFTVLSMGLLSEHSVTKNGEIVVITVCNKVTHTAKTVEVSSAELKNGDWITQKLGLKYTVSDYKSVRVYLNYLLPHAKNFEVITDPGWHDGVYARPKDFVGKGEYQVKATGFEPETYDISETEEAKDKAKTALDTLLACTKKKVIMRMMLFTLIISMLTSVFLRSPFQRIPQYIFALIGVTGTGKTTLVQALLCFLKDYSYFNLSVGYTSASLRKALVKYRDTILFVDDLVDNNDSESMENLDKLTRLFGNAGSSYKTFYGESAAWSRAIFTGEVDPLLRKSSMNRMVLAHISREDIDFDKVTEMNKAETKELYAQAIGDLLLEVSERGPDKVVSELYNSFLDFDNRLNATHKGLCQHRVEAYAWMLAAEKFYREYRGDEKYDDPDALFNYAVQNLKNDYIQSLYEMPEYVFCKTIVESSTKFQQTVAEKPLDSEKWGYNSAEFLYIVDERLERVLYICDLQGINKKALIRSLIQKEIIKPEQGRGQKYRLTVTNVGAFRTYRVDIGKANDFIRDTETCDNIGE